jgi:glycosyltransferase involved in cell wall biosynthesis
MLSVIIPSYNSETTIQRCLDSMMNQTYEGVYEIIVVDSSDDKTPQIVTSLYPKVKLVHLGGKTDPGTARNIGIGEAKGEIIAFTDSDCEAAPEWLQRLVTPHGAGFDIVGGSVHNGNDKADLVGLAGYMLEFRQFLPGLSKRVNAELATCNISYKATVFENHGTFEGKHYPQEDLVFHHQLRKKGEKILFDPEIQVYHHHRTKLNEFCRHQKRIGEITATAMKMIDLEGSWVARRPMLATLLVPFICIVKCARTISVFWRFQSDAIAGRPSMLLPFGLGLFCWGVGFVQGAWKAGSER